MDDSRKIAMTSTSAYLAFTGTLIEQANNALWRKATFRENLLNQAEQNVDFGIY